MQHDAFSLFFTVLNEKKAEAHSLCVISQEYFFSLISGRERWTVHVCVCPLCVSSLCTCICVVECVHSIECMSAREDVRVCVCMHAQGSVRKAAAMPTRWGMVAAQPAFFLSFSSEHQVWSPVSFVHYGEGERN